MPHERELLPGRVFRECKDVHAGRDTEFGLPVLHEIKDRRLLATRHPDGGGGVGRRFAACTGASTASSGLSHDGILNNVTDFNIDPEGVDVKELIEIVARCITRENDLSG